MAISKIEACYGINFLTKEKAKPLSLTPSEINRIMLTIPPELTLENPVKTPVGTWEMEERLTFYCMPTEELAEITIPEKKDRIINKIKAVTRVVFQMD